MISDTPLLSAAGYDDIASKVKAFLQAAKSAAADGITWADFGTLLVALMRLSIATLDDVQNLTGSEKKEIVIHAVGVLFDLVADKAIPLAMYPIWYIARPAVRSLVLALASGAVEQILSLVRAT